MLHGAYKEKMDGSLLAPRVAAGTKFRQIEKAKEMQQIVEERANRAGVEPPQYEFLELIGRGSFGRVFKCKSRRSQEIVAVKITEVDAEDYSAHFKDKDRNVSDLIKEINVLQQLKESRARPYVNIIHEAFSMHSELWIVSEYCPGGSVHTLMKATPQLGLEERFVVAIVRELAMAVKFIHEAGVLHRDIKCGNILITEDGRLQLCDFGVSGVLESEVAKRSTIVGTPNWMAPEIQKEMGSSDFQLGIGLYYGQEIDIWALGITIYELATGGPPEVKMALGGIVTYKSLPRLSNERFSEALRDLVAHVLKEDATERPSAEQILQHPYIANTSETHPTSSLKELIERYIVWEQSGGQRISLFNPNAGAQGPQPFIPPEDQDDDWNFSTSEEMERQIAYSGQLGEAFNDEFGDDFSDSNHMGMGGSRFSMQRQEISIRRGGEGLQRIFDPTSVPYKYGTSDLALRREYGTQESNNRETMINLDDAEPMFTIPSLELGDVPTIRARYSRPMIDLDDEDEQEYTVSQQTRRATRDWKFPDMSGTERSNRKTVEWSFATAMQEAGQNNDEPRQSYLAPQQQRFPPALNTAPIEEGRDRRTRDFVFPPRDSSDSQSTSYSDQGPSLPSQLNTSLPPGFQPTLRHAATEPVGAFEEYYQQPASAPESPLRTSMIDLDFALPSEYMERPSTSGSAEDSIPPPTADFNHTNPFDLEDQVQLSRDNNRTSYHIKSQSEPSHSVPGLLTPNDQDVENGLSRAIHARGVSQFTGPSQQSIAMNNRSRARQRRGLHGPREASMSSTTSTSTSEADTTDDDEDEELKAMLNNDFWRNFHPERYDPNARAPPMPPSDWNFGMDSSFSRGDNMAIQPLTDADITTAPPRLNIRAPPGPGGQRRLVDFPLPVGPNPEALRHDVDAETFVNEFMRMQMQMMNALVVTKEVIIGSDGRMVQQDGAVDI